MRKKAQDRTGNAENWHDLFKPLPFERAATAEEIGAAIAFLASERSGYTSGSVPPLGTKSTAPCTRVATDARGVAIDLPQVDCSTCPTTRA
jgi:NAD(P)-dependent dehydrogenase (short-subunit alcohol dehydrogenase family)